MKKLKILKIFFFWLMISIPHIFADIEAIHLEWNPKISKKSYTAELQKLFENMPGVQEFTVNEQIGKAILKWKQDMRFSFSSLNLGMRRVGPRLRTVKIVVSGKISHHQQIVTLLSKGDNSQFQLFSSQEARHAKDANRSLSPQTRKYLIQAEEKGDKVTIEGILFPPNHLIIDELKTEPSNEKKRRH